MLVDGANRWINMIHYLLNHFFYLIFKKVNNYCIIKIITYKTFTKIYNIYVYNKIKIH